MMQNMKPDFVLTCHTFNVKWVHFTAVSAYTACYRRRLQFGSRARASFFAKNKTEPPPKAAAPFFVCVLQGSYFPVYF